MSYYDDMGLPPSATDDEIRARYRELAMVAHPDRGGDPVVFRLLTEAYDVLGDPTARRAYDAELAGRAAGPGPAVDRRPEGDGPGPSSPERWAATDYRDGPRRGQFYAQVFDGLASLSGADLPRLGRRVLVAAGLGAAVGAGIGLFTGEATALAFGFGLPAGLVAILAFGQARYRDRQ